MRSRLIWDGVVNDTENPKQHRDMIVMDRGFSDEVIVVVKHDAGEDTVTYRRVKHDASIRKKKKTG